MRVLFSPDRVPIASRRRVWVTGTAGAALLSAAGVARAAPVDFSTFQPVQGLPAATFPAPIWETPGTYNGANVPFGRVATESTNADTTFFYSPSLSLHNKVISGDIYFGSDDDLLGIGLGLPTTGNPLQSTGADYLLLQWKGVSQTFDYIDATQSPEFPFHDATAGGNNPAGLSLSRVTGIATADEFWQRANLTMYNPDDARRAPDPAVDPIITPDSGGLAELARGATLGARPYNRSNRRHHFEITYTPTNIQVFVDGVQQFNLNAPTGTTFPNGTLGLFEQGQDGGTAENAFAFFDVRDIGTPAPTPGPDLNPAPVIPASVANLGVPASTANAGSTWAVTSSTPGTAATSILSAANVADVDVAVGGVRLAPDVGVLMATVRQNGPRANDGNAPQYAGVEAPSPSGFNLSTGLATYRFDNGGEWNVNVATAHFPYSAGFRGGYVLPDGLLAYANPGTNYTLTQRRVPLPTIVKYDAATPPAFQNVVTNVRIGGENANTDGLLFAIGTSNEPGGAAAAAGGNYASVSPLADGSWNVAVRDASQAHFGGPDTFEQDDFAFVYLEGADLPGSVGGRVTGLGPGSVPTLAQTWGSFTMTRTGTGRYKVTVLNGPTYDIDILSQTLTGETSPQTLTPTPVDSSFSFAYVPLSPTDISDGMLLLMPNDSITLSDGTVAPLNYFMTYEAGVPIPEPAAAGLLAGAGGLLLARRRRRAGEV